MSARSRRTKVLLGVQRSTSSGGRRVRHAPGADRGGGLEVGEAPQGRVDAVVREHAGGGVAWCAAVPGPPVRLAAGLGGEVLRRVLRGVRGRRAGG